VGGVGVREGTRGEARAGIGEGAGEGEDDVV
jgi:hypothetical protein